MTRIEVLRKHYQKSLLVDFGGALNVQLAISPHDLLELADAVFAYMENQGEYARYVDLKRVLSRLDSPVEDEGAEA